jgi:hypothetical protein
VLFVAMVWFGVMLYRMWLFSSWMAAIFVLALVIWFGLMAWFNFLDENGLMP